MLEWQYLSFFSLVFILSLHFLPLVAEFINELPRRVFKNFCRSSLFVGDGIHHQRDLFRVSVCSSTYRSEIIARILHLHIAWGERKYVCFDYSYVQIHYELSQVWIAYTITGISYLKWYMYNQIITFIIQMWLWSL